MRKILRKIPAAIREYQATMLAERAEAIRHYSRKRPKKAYNFRAYRSPIVKQAVNDLFHGKCAYCESDYSRTQPVDVEHYRPKGRVVDPNGRVRIGYYWLGATWANLLPACIDCNRARYHVNDGLDPRSLSRTARAGKADQFPLANPAKRARRPGEERRERPLLLNPCRDDPSNHLRFLDNGAVVPAQSSRGRVDQRGAATINVLGLWRDGLVRARRKVALRIEKDMVDVLDRMILLVDVPAQSPKRLRLVARLQSASRALDRYAEPREEYSAFALSLIEAFRRLEPVATAYLTALRAIEANPQAPAALRALERATARLASLSSAGQPHAAFIKRLINTALIPLDE